MKNFLDHQIFDVVTEVCGEEGVEAFVIGGFVRDALMGKPSKDIDIVVTGSGIQIAEKVAARISKNLRVNSFRNFGTAMFKYRGREIEFVGARRESYNRNSRKPVVEDGTLEDDQLRRDFTINAMAISLNRNDRGTLIDPFNGRADLNAGIIRTPQEPGTTFSDDPLRMIRAIRFATRFGFTIEPVTFNSISNQAERISIVSAERITDELNKIILTVKPSIGFKLLEESGLLMFILPELARLKGVDAIDGKGHKDNFFHTLEVLDNISVVTDKLWLRWAAVLHDVAKVQTKKFIEGTGWTFHGHEVLGARQVPQVFRRLRLPLGEEMKYVQKLVSLHLRPIVLASEEVTDSAVRRLLFDAGNDIDDLMTLCEADITSKRDDLKSRYLANFSLVRKKLKEIEEKDAVRNFQPPVSGEEIMKVFSLPPCREVGILKNAIKEAILEGEIHNDYQEAFSYLLNKAEAMGLKPAQ
jgi:poly(A) polymerase